MSWGCSGVLMVKDTQTQSNVAGNFAVNEIKGQSWSIHTDKPFVKGQPLRILLIEDNPADIFLIKKLLAKSDFSALELLHAITLEKARLLLHGDFTPDVVLLDLDLPDCSGEMTFDTAVTLLPQVPVVVLSGHTERKVARGLLEKGAYAYIRKDEMTESSLFNSVYSSLHRFSIQQQLLRQKERAENADKEKTTFLGNMSHELRTPLTAIIGFTELLECGESLSEEGRTQLNYVINNARHLNRLVDDLLDLSKAQTGNLEIIPEKFSFKEFLDEIFSTLSITAGKKDLILEAHSEGPIPATVTTDRARLKQILINIIGNAIKFSDRGVISTSVEFKAVKSFEKPVLYFAIADMGPGIPQGKMQYLFRPYGRACSNDRDGSGLGLVVSKGLANRLGGDVRLKNTGAAGSVFEAFIEPNWVSEVARCEFKWPAGGHFSAGGKDKPFLVKRALDKARVLVVEDNKDLGALYRAILSREGAKVDIVDRGRKVPGMVAHHDYDIIVLDLTLPDIGGDEVAVNLRSAGFTKPIIALTAHAFTQYREAALAAGCNDYLTKPVDGITLVNRLKIYLQQEAG